MNEQQAENLRILIRHMETKVKRTLDMSYYGDDECGTPACALGEAKVCAALSHCEWPEPFNGSDGLWPRHAAQAFGEGTENRLFGTAIGNAWRRAYVTPQEWAAEARKVLAENGYSMDDGFHKFLAKTLMPRPELQGLAHEPIWP